MEDAAGWTINTNVEEKINTPGPANQRRSRQAELPPTSPSRSTILLPLPESLGCTVPSASVSEFVSQLNKNRLRGVYLCF